MSRSLEASLVLLLAIGSPNSSPAFSQTVQALPAYHIETDSSRHVECSLDVHTYLPQLSANQWLVIVPQPPDMSGQTVTGQDMYVDGQRISSSTAFDTSPQHRPVLSTVVFSPTAKAHHALDASVSYEVKLSARHLVPGPPMSLPEPLTDIERANFTSPTVTTDYLSPDFATWIANNHLDRSAGESALDYARRSFNTIRSLYSYSYDPGQDRRASAICLTDQADCGGLSNLFVATMRQAGIPARIDIGRWAYSSQEADQLQDMHVKSEFYAEGIGWVPVEMSGAVSNKDDDPSVYFGCDTGQFITLSVDTDYVIETPTSGTKRLLALQGIYLWGTGSGNSAGSTETEAWNVSDLPLPLDGSAITARTISQATLPINPHF